MCYWNYKSTTSFRCFRPCCQPGTARRSVAGEETRARWQSGVAAEGCFRPCCPPGTARRSVAGEEAQARWQPGVGEEGTWLQL